MSLRTPGGGGGGTVFFGGCIGDAPASTPKSKKY